MYQNLKLNLMKPIVYIEKRFDPNTLPKEPSKNVPGVFYHGVTLSGEYGWYAALNILESGMLQTPNYVAYWEPNLASSHNSVRYREIKDLKYRGQSSGGLTPMAMNFLNVASGIRQGLHMQKGSIKYTDDQEKEMIKRSRVEINFEIERRKYAKNAVSRLECLYIADNEATIREMFNHHPDLLIFKVKIAEALNYTKVDSKWYEEYLKTGERKYIKKYWTGSKCNENISSWEYLVDGLIIIDDHKHLAYLNTYKEELEEEFKFNISTSQERSIFMAYN